MIRNAIILAAGKSNRFAPFTYERPKGLFRVKNEVLIERQIRQLIEAGVYEIIVVVGYMKEKFFYLEEMFPQVRLIINNNFGVKGNLYSVYVAREYLHNTILSYADYYFEDNPFIVDKHNKFGIGNISYHSCVYCKGKITGFSLQLSNAEVITHVDFGGNDQYAMRGHAYFNESFSAKFVELLDKEINDFRVSSLFWEEFFERHISELTLFARKFDCKNVIEFNAIDDLRQFDADFIYNVDSNIIKNICDTLKCDPNRIKDIAVINAGLTNVSFKFSVDNIEYVYRHPGGTAGNLIDRTAEMFSQMTAKSLNVDKSVITMSLSGWKLSYCVQNLVDCDFRKHHEQLDKGMEFLRKIHSVDISSRAIKQKFVEIGETMPMTQEARELYTEDLKYVNADKLVKDFDDVHEGLKLMKIASATKGNLLYEFREEIRKVKKLDEYVKADAKRLGYPRVCCHNDTYEPNFLATKDGDLYLIDWEYAGLNYAANDLACFFSRYMYTDDEIETYLKSYFKRELTEDEHRFYIAFIAICAFYWIGWGLYKGSVGDDDGFFFLPAYRNFHRFIDVALKSYER